MCLKLQGFLKAEATSPSIGQCVQGDRNQLRYLAQENGGLVTRSPATNFGGQG